MTNRELAQYLRNRLQFLVDINHRFEEQIRKDKQELIDRTTDMARVGTAIYYLDCGLGRTFRYMILIGVCSFVEESLKAIAAWLVPNDDERRKTLAEPRQGGEVEKYLYLLQRKGFDSESCQKEL